MTSADVRERLVEALRADLVGPFVPSGDEVLPQRPTRWYLTGFLAPSGAAEDVRTDDTAQETLEVGDDDTTDDAHAAERAAARKAFFPSSIGLSVFVRAESKHLGVRLRWADYHPVEERDAEGRRKSDLGGRRWQRRPLEAGPVAIDLARPRQALDVPDSRGLKIYATTAVVAAPGLPKGTRAVSVFVVNERVAISGELADTAFVFQVELEVRCEDGLAPRPNVRGHDGIDSDEQRADLQYRDVVEYAVGHGVATTLEAAEGRVTTARTSWIPAATVHRVRARSLPGVEVSMEALAQAPDGKSLRVMVARLLEAYGKWIEDARGRDVGSPARRETAAALLDRAEAVRRRIAEGLDVLERDPLAFEAFRIANRVMAISARQRSPERYASGEKPSWFLFQLAFVVMNVAGIVDPAHRDRETVELIFFPTGGGKTEAYLGVAAFALALRRLRGAQRADGGAGVAVLLRYTLRLLTLDQLGRAATLICALELERARDPRRLGSRRFSIGLWVGKSATANRLDEVRKQVIDYRNGKTKISPVPIPECPWCRTALGPDSLHLEPDALLVGCRNGACPFCFAQNTRGLPVLVVDEQIYPELPCFIVATVDKFAMLPWQGRTGALLGKVQAFDAAGFYGPCDPKTGAKLLPEGLLPPDLIIQDELHLISGPLGTMAGLYETAIEALATRVVEGKRVVPKIVASTATVRRAGDQVRALYGRSIMELFPPPGIDADDSFFAQTERESAGRLYVGVAAPGRSIKAALLRTYVTLLAAGQRLHRQAGDAADPYMTLVGYFNSLRELGGARRLVEDEVGARCERIEERRTLGSDETWFASRRIAEPRELTSRESTSDISKTRAQLAKPFDARERIDVLLASNMISVGIDIDRLGLMVVCGQPRTTAEYIQATSRVGRDARRPGLAVTLFNVHRPRDRSYYERFQPYHASFYRFVEVTSVTPFSPRAVDRGLAGVAVALARHLDPRLTPPSAATQATSRRQAFEAAADALADRAARHRILSAEEAAELRAVLRRRALDLYDTWQTLAAFYVEQTMSLCYSRFEEGTGKPLLWTALDPELEQQDERHRKFVAPTSLREVEPNVHLWVNKRLQLAAPDGS